MAFEKSKEPVTRNRIQEALSDSDSKPTQALLKAYSVRLPERDIDVLQAHFVDKGLKLGQGLRMIIKSYMKKEGI